MSETGQLSGVIERSFVLRIVACAQSGRTGEEFPVEGSLVIGRDSGCSVVLADTSVSRRHAQVEPTVAGLRVTDLNSGNGVWIGARRVREVIITPGDRFQIGSTLFECLEDLEEQSALSAQLSALSSQLSAGEAEAEIVLRVVESGGNEPVGKTFRAGGAGALTIGRSPECDIAIGEKDVSRRHATIERTADGLVVTDLGSSGGVWVDGMEVVRAVIRPGQAFRLAGRIVLVWDAPAARAAPPVAAKAPAAAAPEDSDATRFMSGTGGSRSGVAGQMAPGASAVEEAGQSVIIPMPPEVAVLLKESGRLEDEGEELKLSAHQPFLLDDLDSAWHVVEGGVLIFTVAIEKGEPVGTRTHFLGILPGQVFFGFDFRQYGAGFLAVPKQGTTVRKIPRARLQQIAAQPKSGPVVAAVLDSWVSGLSKALVPEMPARRAADLLVEPGKALECGREQKVRSKEGVVWVDVWSGSILFDDMATPIFSRRSTLFPLTPDSWIESVGDAFGPMLLDAAVTAKVVANPAFWEGLETFHQVVCESEFINKKLKAVDEFIRLQQKAQHSQAAADAAYEAIGSVLRTEAGTPNEFLAPGRTEAVLSACQMVGAALGVEVLEHPDTDEGLTYEERVASIASASGFRTRVVTLRDKWWMNDNGPLVGQLSTTKDPVAILPTSPRSYECVDPTAGTRSAVDETVAASLSGFAFALYRPLPDGDLRVLDVVRFGTQKLKSDIRWVVAMAIIVGMAGTVTPYITGKVFDSAIPQADRGALLGFGVALLFSALATSAFKLTQGIGTLRIQAKMSSSIQGAVWDRLLNLPTNFFKQYSAGDLADRAEGVEAIQELVSGAVVGAILGAVSGVFYVGQMFSYNLRLALLAVLLTIVFVGFNLTANYFQLRYQRAEFRLRGRITGLVLNLLTGVSKIRVCGAEHHAFRVWAEQFAQQRKISFSVGTIQNIQAVLASIYPVVSSITIFYVVVSEQARVAATHEPGGLTTGQFIAFNAAFGLFLAAMQGLGDASLSLLRVVPIYERLEPILDTKPEVDRTKAYPGKLRGEIELSHVHFRYDADGPWIIKDVSLKIKAGEFIAFVGSSGGGKSTLMRLLLGFETPTSGSIDYDGQDLSAIDLRLFRQQIGVVLQASRVMPTEIYRNIVGASSRTIDDAWEAAEKAGLAADIRNMPMGMHTYVSEGGGTLSGGQRQRLMIARAVVNRPKIIFLDEATSALDNRTQAIVTESMDRMDATRIVIAHRLSTVINANRICFLDGGQIAEIGSHQELMARNGLFAQLAKRQMA